VIWVVPVFSAGVGVVVMVVLILLALRLVEDI